MPSFFLQAQCLKIKSYPFDWCFSDKESISHCIKDKFKDYLNKDFYKPHSRKQRPSIYNIKTNIIYPHGRDPVNDMPYYERCIERFNKMIESGEPTLFVTTLKNRKPLEAQLRELNEDIHFIEIPELGGKRKKVESLILTDKEYDLREKYDFSLR